MFYGHSFLYDSIPSETYGLYIREIDGNGINESMGSSSMEILEQKIYRRSTPFFYGATASPKLTFDFSAFAEKEIDAEDFSIIQKWLFSKREYKIFQIDQIDMQDIYFNVILNDPKIVRIGNMIQGFTCTVEANSPFAYRFPQTIVYSYTSSTVDANEVYYNGSDDDGSYLYPQLVITMNNFAGGITITNESDSNRVFQLINLQANEVITIDNSIQTISSSTGLKRLSNFNKHFLRLVPGLNRLRISGNVANIAMTNTFIVKKIGG